MRRFAAPVLGLCLATSFPSAAHAESKPPSAPRYHELERTSFAALGLETLAFGVLEGSGWLLTGGARTQCRWCESNRFDEAVRGTLRADAPRPPALISHALSLGAVPTLALTGLIVPAVNDGTPRRAVEDSWMVINAFLLTTAVGDLTKHLVARERPTFHHHLEQTTEFSRYPKEHNKSFFSLDTAWAFSIASSAATIAHLRGYPSRNLIALGGGLLAASAGTLRIVADAHWTTDVLTGAAVGTAIGIALPALMHSVKEPSDSSSVAISPLNRGTEINLRLVF